MQCGRFLPIGGASADIDLRLVGFRLMRQYVMCRLIMIMIITVSSDFIITSLYKVCNIVFCELGSKGVCVPFVEPFRNCIVVNPCNQIVILYCCCIALREPLSISIRCNCNVMHARFCLLLLYCTVVVAYRELRFDNYKHNYDMHACMCLYGIRKQFRANSNQRVNLVQNNAQLLLSAAARLRVFIGWCS
jgi:hypothetical protein